MMEIDDLYFTENEETDVKIFQQFVTPHYNPSNEPIAMGVGVLMPTERSAIKVYNLKQFGIPLENTRVAGCNKSGMPPSMQTIERFKYDHFSDGFHGDARTPFPFMKALHALNKDKFDLVYIRNPDLFDVSDWGSIFYRAFEWTASSGALVTLIRSGDVRKYATLLDHLKENFSIEPVFSGETGIRDSRIDISEEDSHHTVGVFKVRSDCI
jgi:hypothetical protein